MAVSITANAVISSTWTNFKPIAITTKSLAVQYDDDGIVYTIFAFDGSAIAYLCTIWKGTVPDGIITSGYSQSQNDTDKTDFETNYKPTANTRVSRTDTYGDPIHLDFVDAVCFGQIPNAVVGTANGYLGTAALTTVAIRATSYIADTVAAQRSLVSSSTSDTSAGTGARTVKITYFDNTCSGPFTEIVTMNGTTAVNTTNTNIRFIEKIEVATVGSTGSNVGTISLKQNTGGTGSTLGSIAINDNSTFWAHHYVASGKKARLYAVRGGASITNGVVNLISTGDPTSSILPSFNISNGIRIGSGNQVVSTFDWTAPLTVTGPNLIYLNIKPDAVTASTVYGSFDYVEF